MSSPREALEAFAEQNPDLARLESLLSKFNLFEAIGVVRQELRHSNLLAFLLDPSQSHGLGAVFLKELLQSVFLQTEVESTVSSSDLDSWDLRQATVQREWHHIDILVLDDVNRFAVLIENKIDTGEHSDQLNRYYKDVQSHYPGYKIAALHLTPDGDAPTSDLYHAVSYLQVCQVAERLVALRRSTLGSDIVMLLEHYAQMLRRHIVSDSNVAELCRSIYQKHRQALDLIFEHRPDQQAQIGQHIKMLIRQRPDIILDPDLAGKSWLNFALREWEESPLYGRPYQRNSQERQWLPYFQFWNAPNKLDLVMAIAIGNLADRATLFQMARAKGFQGCPSKLGTSWFSLFKKPLLIANDYEKSQEEIEALISDRWAAFLRDDLPYLAQAIRDEKWLWVSHKPCLDIYHGTIGR